jgi:hypothetical protein
LKLFIYFYLFLFIFKNNHTFRDEESLYTETKFTIKSIREAAQKDKESGLLSRLAQTVPPVTHFKSLPADTPSWVRDVFTHEQDDESLDPQLMHAETMKLHRHRKKCRDKFRSGVRNQVLNFIFFLLKINLWMKAIFRNQMNKFSFSFRSLSSTTHLTFLSMHKASMESPHGVRHLLRAHLRLSQTEKAL